MPFEKGRSGNPAVKKPGTRHKATLAAEALLAGESEALTRKAVEMALDGDTTALCLCLERIYPPRRDHPAQVSLPEINKTEDIMQSMSKVIEAVSSGDITPTEASTLAKVLGEQAKAIEVQDHESRIAKLENERRENENTR